MSFGMTGEGMRRQAIILWRILVKLCGGPSDFQYVQVLKIHKYKKSLQSTTRNRLGHSSSRTTSIRNLVSILILFLLSKRIFLVIMDIEENLSTGPTGHSATTL